MRLKCPKSGTKSVFMHLLMCTYIYSLQSNGLDDSILYVLKRIKTKCLSHKVKSQKHCPVFPSDMEIKVLENGILK